jgi:hypothetical protein
VGNFNSPLTQITLKEIVMGIAKAKLFEAEENYATAISLLVEVGALEECEDHSGTFFDCDSEKLEDAYRLVNSRITAGKSPFGDLSRSEATDLLKQAYEDNSGVDDCQECS